MASEKSRLFAEFQREVQSAMDGTGLDRASAVSLVTDNDPRFGQFSGASVVASADDVTASLKSLTSDYLWVYSHLGEDDVSREDAPSGYAWKLFESVGTEEGLAAFQGMIESKILPSGIKRLLDAGEGDDPYLEVERPDRALQLCEEAYAVATGKRPDAAAGFPVESVSLFALESSFRAAERAVPPVYPKSRAGGPGGAGGVASDVQPGRSVLREHIRAAIQSEGSVPG